MRKSNNIIEINLTFTDFKLFLSVILFYLDMITR